MGVWLRRLRTLVGAAAFSFAACAGAEPLVALIIDDLGDRLAEGRRAVALPGPVTLSFLPQTPFAVPLARNAHASGKEIMLHLPMDSVERRPLGPGGVTIDMTEGEFLRTLRSDLDAIPHVRGVNNHMGSLLTRHPGHMGWLMGELRARDGLYFVDSRTTAASVAPLLAGENNVPSVSRDVFLDHDPSPNAIRRQFARLLAQARRIGAAVGIGHPYPETLGVLEQVLPELSGVRLVPVSQLIALSKTRRPKLWQASLSPSPTAARNSKP